MKYSITQYGDNSRIKKYGVGKASFKLSATAADLNSSLLESINELKSLHLILGYW